MFRFLTRPLTHLRWLGLAALLLASATQAQDDLEGGLLPVTKAFQLSGSLASPGHIHLHWTIAQHYYLYRSHIKITPAPGLQLGEPQLPRGHQYHDEYLGDVETYHDSLDAEVPYSGQGPVQIQVQYQGCHEVDPKICYPPHTETLTLGGGAATTAAAPAADDSGDGSKAAAAASSGTAPASADLATLGQRPDNGAAALPVEQAFVLQAAASSPHQLLLRWQMPPGYYLYKSQIHVQLANGQSGQIKPLHWPSGTAHHDNYYGDSIVYFDTLELPLELSGLPATVRSVELQVRYQGCKQDGICYPAVDTPLQVSLDGQPSHPAAAPASTSSLAGGLNLWLLLSALLGGLLLNLLPCVLPVLSLKVLGILDNSHELKALRRHALYYSVGVLASFIVVDLVAHAFGQGLGAQLQRPMVVAVLACVMAGVGLSLSGVVDFTGRFSNVGQSLASRGGRLGDFFTGVLAVVVASPCTGPLMGPPVAYALTAPLASSLAVFVALGLGLALPVILIALVPGLARRLPRPGLWMETLKQWLAFPMYLTAVWLAWVLAKQRGADAVALVLVAIVALAMTLWWLQRSRQRALGLRLLLLPMAAATIAPLLLLARLPAPTPVTTASDSGVVAYTPQKLAQLQAAGTPVLVDMTADWCVTCKANEHTVLDSDAFKQLLQQTGAVYMKGDWTDVNPTIAAFLKHYRSPGVPLYVVFSRHGGDGEVLPTVLTPGLVKAALQRAAQ
ncbi:protein-disulfide reductase DsbD family protein [Frateuria aurantia]